MRDKQGNLGYLGAHSHTHVGHFVTYWFHLGDGYATNLSDLAECSAAAAHWLDGFLSGAEPEGRFIEEDEFDYDPADPRTGWYFATWQRFHLTGTWPRDRTPEPGEPTSNWPRIH